LFKDKTGVPARDINAMARERAAERNPNIRNSHHCVTIWTPMTFLPAGGSRKTNARGCPNQGSVNSLNDGDVEFDRYSVSKYASHQAIQTPQAMPSGCPATRFFFLSWPNPLHRRSELDVGGEPHPHV
jgi:hypothetical protein